jgi:predicted transglutaminase-like protease
MVAKIIKFFRRVLKKSFVTAIASSYAAFVSSRRTRFTIQNTIGENTAPTVAPPSTLHVPGHIVADVNQTSKTLFKMPTKHVSPNTVNTWGKILSKSKRLRKEYIKQAATVKEKALFPNNRVPKKSKNNPEINANG